MPDKKLTDMTPATAFPYDDVFYAVIDGVDSQVPRALLVKENAFDHGDVIGTEDLDVVYGMHHMRITGDVELDIINSGEEIIDSEVINSEIRFVMDGTGGWAVTFATGIDIEAGAVAGISTEPGAPSYGQIIRFWNPETASVKTIVILGPDPADLGSVAVAQDGSTVVSVATVINFTGPMPAVVDAGGGQVDVDITDRKSVWCFPGQMMIPIFAAGSSSPNIAFIDELGSGDQRAPACVTFPTGDDTGRANGSFLIPHGWNTAQIIERWAGKINGTNTVYWTCDHGMVDSEAATNLNTLSFTRGGDTAYAAPATAHTPGASPDAGYLNLTPTPIDVSGKGGWYIPFIVRRYDSADSLAGSAELYSLELKWVS